MLQQQRSSSSLRMWVALAGCCAAGMALSYGWERFGWATPVELRDGLRLVGESVSACKEELKSLLGKSFAEVGDSLSDVTRHVVEVKEELKAEVHAVGESVESLEQRMRPIETDVRRTAQGVDLLCEVVAGLSSNASPELLRRLDTFTGSEGRLEARVEAREVLTRRSRTPEPMPSPPLAGVLPAPVAFVPTSARPEFLQSILQPRFEVRSQ